MESGRSLPPTRIGRTALLFDTAVALTLTIVSVLAVQVAIETAPPGYEPPPTGLVLILTTALTMPLALRRRFPLAVLIVVTAVFFPYRIADIPDLTVSIVVYWLALFSAGAYGSPRWRDWVRGLNVAASLGYLGYRLVAASGTMPSTSLLLRAGFLLLLNAFFIGAAWFYGNAVAARREYETQLVQRAAQLERERDINARQAVLRERVRVARDLHDVVAHHVSLIGIQAAAARRGLPQEPDRAVAGLRAIEQSSRDGLQELHRMLGLLRQPDEEADGVAGQPTVQDVPALIEAVRGTALHVDLERVGEGRPVPAEVGTSAYRIIQEALTNTIRHSNARQAHVVVAVFDDHLELEVRDDGAPVRTGAGTEGQGLRGMRERAALAGGVVEAGPLPGRGYRVSASLPLFAGRA